ncbi:hypothetical protein BC827DRAFT_1268032 [Russula dissimulans]|nr:hypothetical protein BC827DRAFT_1268032 [Russula dissimulans]
MSKARTSVEKARNSKGNQNKVVSKASEVVNALLEPASQVVNLLNGIGAFFPPCKVASNTLSVIVKLEIDRRDSDVRIAVLFLDLATALANLGTLSPGLMTEFGQFCEAYYESKSLKSKLSEIPLNNDSPYRPCRQSIKYLLSSKSNRDSLQSFSDRLAGLKNDLTSLLSQQTVLVLKTHTDTLSRIESRLVKNRQFYATISDRSEDSATAFVSRHGGEDAVRTHDGLLKQLAETVGENLNASILRTVKEGAEETLKQSQASFMLKFQFALEHRIEESHETILNELKSGPYELILDPDVKATGQRSAGHMAGDADNQLYSERIIKTYTQLGKLKDAGGPNADLVDFYHLETKERVTVLTNSLYNMRELDPSAQMKMDRLRDELCARNEHEIKTRLKSVNHKIDYSVLAAVTGSERIERTFFPLASLLISRHLWLMSKPKVSIGVVEEAISSVMVLIDAIRGRIEDLKMIWRRQRMGVDTQTRYYANGLLQDYYRKYRKEEFDTNLENFDEESEWDSEDAWTSEDGIEGDNFPQNGYVSGPGEQYLYQLTLSGSPSYGWVQGQSYSDSIPPRGFLGYEDDHENDEDQEGDADEGYLDGIEDDEGQGYYAYYNEDYGAHRQIEDEYDSEDDGGYGHGRNYGRGHTHISPRGWRR